MFGEIDRENRERKRRESWTERSESERERWKRRKIQEEC
jgi:hypothetical protein